MDKQEIDLESFYRLLDNGCKIHLSGPEKHRLYCIWLASKQDKQNIGVDGDK